MKRISWAVQASLFYLFTLTLSFIPRGLVTRAGQLTGMGMFILLPKRRSVAVDNIRQALPHMQLSPDWNCPLATPEEIARETFINMGKSLVETCRLYHCKGEDLIDSIEIRGWEHYEAARARGKGLIFLTGHCGNWELVALAYSRIFKASMSVVARRQNNPYLNRMVETMRMHFDNRVIYKDNALRNMISVIRKNGTIGLLVDQAVFPEEGALIPFLGRNAWASKAPVILARKTGVPIMPAFVHREGDRHILTVHPECVFDAGESDESMAANVKHYSEYIERFITTHPTDWYWVHRRWKRTGEAVQ
ncbi:MAG: lysophospholipid acyltransferase family protein [Desulfuromonadales bacterium]|nr:lysophospholipid acyltransferase family protein [Desulfuromonadales bacterium]